MSNEKTQLWKQAIEIYQDISELPAADALKQIDSIHNLSYELKQAVITLVNSGNQASQYIEQNFSPDLMDTMVQEMNYHVGDDLAEYHLLEELGKGGMSFVFKAKRKDVEPQKLVAIKIFSPKSYSPQLLEHFISEQNILSELSHPHIVDMLHGGKTEDGTTYLVMELIDEALPINDYCKNLNSKQKIKYITQCAKALAYSHANLIIHRDLKPDNILIDKQGQLKIVDFGIAKLINNDIQGDKTTIMAMTPSYAAPEQINSKKISTKTDIFSLAVVALELVNGERFLPKDRLIKSCEKDEQVIDSTLKHLSADKDLKNILHHALAQNPNERYASMQSFADDLDNYLNNLPVTATSQSLFYRLGKFAKRRKALFLTSMTLLASLILGLGVTLWQNKQIKLEASKADSVKEFMLNAFEVTNPNNTQGANVSANDILKIAATKLDNSPNLANEIKFELYQSLGIANFQLGFYPEAINLLKKSLNIDGNNSKSTAFLANSYLLAEKQIELQQLLAKTDEWQFESNADTIQMALVRAKDLSINGSFEQAQAIITKVQKLPIYPDNPLLQTTVQLTLARVNYEKSDHQEAIKILKSVIATSKLPKTHILMLNARLELGRSYNTIGEQDLALEAFNQLETDYKNILGENHPDLGIMYTSMASVYRAKGQIKKAREYAQKSYEYNVKNFNNKGVAVAESLNFLAVFSFSIDQDLPQAIEYTEEGLKILSEIYAPDNPHILELKTNYAFLLSQNKQSEKALEILQQVHESQSQKLGENHYATIETESKIIGTLIKLKHYQKAKEMALSHLQKVKKLVNKKNIRSMNAYLLLAKVYLYTKEKQKRLDTLLELEQVFPADNLDKLSIILRNIAQTYHSLGKDKKAEEYFLKSINSVKDIFPASHLYPLKQKIHYAKFLQAINRFDDVKKILTELKKYIKQENYTDAFLLKKTKELENYINNHKKTVE